MSAASPLFSIVTISFNQERFLERTLRSVIEQEGVAIEYIVVDPGSTDGSRALINRYRDQLAHVVLDRDDGPADGLNKGFAHATGDILGYLNSDDVLYPDALARVRDYFAAHPDIDVVSGSAWIIDGEDRKLRRAWSDAFGKWRWAYGASVQLQPSTFIRAAAFRRSGGFNIANRVGWDAELTIDLFKTGARFGRIDAFLSGYRLHSESITNSGKLWEQMMEQYPRGFEKMMGRPMTKADRVLAYGFRAVKRVLAPRATWERITMGPVSRRGIE